MFLTSFNYGLSTTRGDVTPIYTEPGVTFQIPQEQDALAVL